MDAVETHRKVLELLGFDALSFEHGETDEYLGGLWWALVYDDSEYTDFGVISFKLEDIENYHSESESDAWAQAPTLETLMPKLIETMTGKAQPYVLCIGQDMDGTDKWLCRLANPHDETYGDLVEGDNIYHAIAALFVAACEAGLVDPTPVRL